MAEAKKHSKVRLIFWGFLGVLILFAMIVYLICEQADSVKIPESLKMAPIELPPPPRPVAGAPVRVRPSALVTSSTQFSGFSEYLQFRLARDPGLESARLYLELEKRLQELDKDEDFRLIFSIRNMGRFTPEQERWLRANASLITLVQRFSRSGSLPFFTIEERLDNLKRTGTFLPVASYMFYYNCMNLLVSEGRLQTRDGNPAAARQAVQDVLRLAGMLQGADGFISRVFVINLAVYQAILSLAQWISDPNFPKSEMEPLLAALERFDADARLPESVERCAAFEYLENRYSLVRLLEAPTWRSPLYGWDLTEHPGDYEVDFQIPGTHHRVTLPDVGHMIAKSYVAIRNREHSAEALQAFDRVCLKIIESVKHPYSRCVPENEALLRELERDFVRYLQFSIPVPNYITFRTYALVDETWLHLSRVGIGLRVDPQRTRGRRAEGLGTDPHHPWRDPFTEKPLQMDESSSPTLVWSLGPDLKDQHGAVCYDPSNGTVSEGDIVIRVAR